MTAEITNLVATVLLSVAASQSGAPATNGGKFIRIAPKPLAAKTNLVTSAVHYQGPKGNGYIVNVKYIQGTNIYSRCINVGPNDWMNTKWLKTSVGKTNKVVKPIEK